MGNWLGNAWDKVTDTAEDVGKWAWKNRWLATPFAPAPVIGSYVLEEAGVFDGNDSGNSDKIQQDVQDLSEEINEVDPYSVDWDVGLATDSEGNVVKDYSGYYDQIEEAAATNIPTLDEYMASNDYQFHDPLATDADGNYINPVMQNLVGLTDEMAGGPTDAELAEAKAYAADMLGMSPEEYQNTLLELSQAVEGGVNEAEGMSEEERALRERANRSELRQMEARAERQIENIQANTGSTSRSLAAADEAMRSINDAQIQQQVALADEEFRRQVAQYEGQQQMWQQMVQSGQMAKSEYLNLVQKSKAQAFQGYAAQMNAMFQQNQEYLQRYENELRAVEASINNTYKAVMTEMGVDAALMDFVEQSYNMEMAPLLTQVDLLLGQQELALAEEESNQSAWMDFLTIGVQLAAIAA